MDEALSNAKAAAAAWLEAALTSGDRVPPPSALDDVRSRPEFAGCTFDLVEVAIDRAELP